MEVLQRGWAPGEDRAGSALFVRCRVPGHTIVGRGMNTYYNLASVGFGAGGPTKFHAHTSDQILYVTEGAGIVADERQEIEIKPGDTAWIPAGERHWHGATPDSSFTHISLQTADSTTEILE